MITSAACAMRCTRPSRHDRMSWGPGKIVRPTPIASANGALYMQGVAGSALCVRRSIPVALSKSEGAGSVRALVRLSGAHLY